MTPKQRKPGQTGNPFGQGKNAQTFNARQRKSKSGGLWGCAVIGIVAGLMVGIPASALAFGLVTLVL